MDVSSGSSEAMYCIRTNFDPLPSPLTNSRPQSSKSTSTGRKLSSHCALGGLCASKSIGSSPIGSPLASNGTYTTLYPVGLCFTKRKVRHQKLNSIKQQRSVHTYNITIPRSMECNKCISIHRLWEWIDVSTNIW